MDDYRYWVTTVNDPSSYSTLGYDELPEADALACQTSLETGMAWVRFVGSILPSVIYIDGWAYKRVEEEQIKKE